MIAKYIKKPVAVTAAQWTGINQTELKIFTNDTVAFDDEDPCVVFIPTLEGVMTAHIGDYIIKGVRGEFYPCRRDIFEETYERG